MELRLRHPRWRICHHGRRRPPARSAGLWLRPHGRDARACASLPRKFGALSGAHTACSRATRAHCAPPGRDGAPPEGPLQPPLPLLSQRPGGMVRRAVRGGLRSYGDGGGDDVPSAHSDPARHPQGLGNRPLCRGRHPARGIGGHAPNPGTIQRGGLHRGAGRRCGTPVVLARRGLPHELGNGRERREYPSAC